MEKINVYIDGPNLLGAVSDLKKKRVWVDPFKLSQGLIDQQRQEIGMIFYAETPYSENLHNVDTFRRQQSFFGHIHAYIQEKRITHIKGNYRIDTTRVPASIVEST